MNRISRFYRISAPAPAREMDEAARDKYYRRLRMQAFIAATLGYSLYYVCRTSLNVMKKPILDSGSLDASQLGVIGSALLFAYAIGKFVNGFIADYCNIKRFMATGLIVSAAANMLMGVLGLMHSVIPTAVIFIAFAVMWGLNGWSQSMGAAPAIISLSRWYPLKERGTYYGFFSASHNLGEFFSFLFVGSIVTFAGWQAGFFGSAIAGAIGVVVILLMLHDTPESKGLPPVEALAHEKPAASADKSVKEIQKQVLRTPAVWILAAASAFMYISRYAINGWGVLFLQEAKGFSDVEAISVVSINALLGILGTVLSGWFSDKLFKGDRKVPALIFGVLNAAALALFFYGGNAMWVNVLSMVLFGIAIGVLICFLGGPDGRRHRAAEGYGRRTGRRGDDFLYRCGHSGRGERLADRLQHHRCRRRGETLRFRPCGDLLACGGGHLVPAAAVEPRQGQGVLENPEQIRKKTLQGLCLQRFFVCAERAALSVDALFSLLRRPDGDDAVDDELREAPPGQRPEILLIVQFERLSPLQHQLARQRFVLDRELELVGLDRPGGFRADAGLDQFAFVGLEKHALVDDVVQFSALDALAEDEEEPEVGSRRQHGGNRYRNQYPMLSHGFRAPVLSVPSPQR